MKGVFLVRVFSFLSYYLRKKGNLVEFEIFLHHLWKEDKLVEFIFFIFEFFVLFLIFFFRKKDTILEEKMNCYILIDKCSTMLAKIPVNEIFLTLKAYVDTDYFVH